MTLDLGHGVIVPPECCEFVKAPVEKLPNIFPVQSPKLSPNPAYLIHLIRVAMDLNVLPEFASNNLASRGILEYHTLPIRKKIGDFVIISFAVRNTNREMGDSSPEMPRGVF